MIYVTGDIHGEVRTLLNWLDKCHIPHEKEHIIVLLRQNSPQPGTNGQQKSFQEIFQKALDNKTNYKYNSK